MDLTTALHIMVILAGLGTAVVIGLIAIDYAWHLLKKLWKRKK